MKRRRVLRGIAIAAVIAALVAIYPAYRLWASQRVERFKAECAAASSRKDWAALESVAGRWSAWDPASGDAWLYLAEAASETGELAIAAERLARVPDSDPRCVAALSHRVELLFTELNDPKAAAETCRRILKIDPRTAVAHQRLIFFLSMTLQRQAMVAQIREAIRLRREPPEAYVYLVGADWIHFSNGYALNSRWLEDRPDEELYLVARAGHLAWSGRHSGASSGGGGGAPSGAKLMAECRERFPRNLEVLAYFVENAVSNGDVELVAELLADLPASASGDNRFWRARGWLHATQDEYPEAEKAYRQAIQLNPYDWKARHELAAVLRNLGVEEATEVSRIAAEGKEIGMRLAELPNASEAPGDLLARVAEYAGACGDAAVVSGLAYRLSPDGMTGSTPTLFAPPTPNK